MMKPWFQFSLITSLYLISNSAWSGNATESYSPSAPTSSQKPTNTHAPSSGSQARTYNGTAAAVNNTVNLLNKQYEDSQAEYERAMDAQNKQGAQRETDARQRQNQAEKDPFLNPWKTQSRYSTVNKTPPRPESPSPQSQNALPLDPSADYDGQPCKYFTKTSDEAHLLYHSDGAMVSYGGRIYSCKGGTWQFRTTSDHFWGTNQQLNAMEAAQVENSR